MDRVFLTVNREVVRVFGLSIKYKSHNLVFIKLPLSFLSHPFQRHSMQ